jgi:hypothetical protein
MTSITIPFTCEIGELGLTEAHGLINFSDKTGLIIEFQTQDTILGVIKSGTKKVNLPWNEIADFNVEKKWFSGRIRIRGNTLDALGHLPGVHAGEFKVKIKKHDIETARRLRSELLLQISEKRLELLENHEE